MKAAFNEICWNINEFHVKCIKNHIISIGRLLETQTSVNRVCVCVCARAKRLFGLQSVWMAKWLSVGQPMSLKNYTRMTRGNDLSSHSLNVIIIVICGDKWQTIYMCNWDMRLNAYEVCIEWWKWLLKHPKSVVINTKGHFCHFLGDDMQLILQNICISNICRSIKLTFTYIDNTLFETDQLRAELTEKRNYLFALENTFRKINRKRDLPRDARERDRKKGKKLTQSGKKWLQVESRWNIIHKK